MPAGVIISEQPTESLTWIEKTALVVALKGPDIEETIMDLNMNNAEFSFLRSSDPSHALYQQKLIEYRSKIDPNQPDAPATHDRVGDASYLEPEPRDCAFTSPAAQFVARKIMSAGVIISEQPTESLTWIEQTALLVARKGPNIEKTIMDLNMNNPELSFLRSSDPSHALYQQKLTEYRSKNQGGYQDLQPDAPATHDGVGDASYLEPEPRDCAFTSPAKTLGIIKLTAQFVARYGMDFREFLMERVAMNPLFNFMKPTYGCFSFYDKLVVAYSRVLKPSNSDARIDSILDAFFHGLQLEKLEKGMETVLLDLHAFVGGVDSFTRMDDAGYLAIVPPPERFSVMMNRLTQTQPDMLVQPQPGSQLTEYGARNQYEAQDLQPDASATNECVGDAETDLGPPPISITLKELGIIKLTAQFVARYGMHFRRALMMRVVLNPLFEFMFFRRALMKRVPRFEFMEQTEIRFNIFNVLVGAYSRVLMPSKMLSKSDACTGNVLEYFFNSLQLESLEEGVETAMIDLHAFVGGVDFFAHTDDADYSAIMPPSERLSMMMNRLTQTQPDMLVQLPLGSQLKQYERVGDSIRLPALLRSLTFRFPARGITLKELGIMKLTAQFAARYGSFFWERVCMNPSFDFLKPSDSRFSFYCGLLAAYTRVLKFSKKLRKGEACSTILLEGFFNRLQLERLEEGMETAMIDLHAFVGGVDCLAHMDDADYSAIMAEPEGPSMMINQLRHMQRPLGSRLSEYLAQNQGGATHECVGDAQPDLSTLSPGEQLLRQEQRRIRGFEFPDAFSGRISFKELGIMKLTAMFVARYGMHFCRDLIKQVVMKPQFKFMEPANSMFSLYNAVVKAYSRVLEPSDDDDADTATVLGEFFRRLRLEKLEGEAMLDLHAFVSGVDYFAGLEDVDYCVLMPPPELLSSIMKRTPSLREWLPLENWCLFPRADAMGMMQTSRPEEPEAKRQKSVMSHKDQ